MTRTVLVAGGGTAGHVFPAVAVARELRRQAPDVEPVFLGVADRLEARLVPEEGFDLHLIDAVSVPRRPSPKLLKVPSKLRAGVRRATAIVRERQAVAAVTFGGYVSFPLNRAATKAGIPLVIHEQNSVPGLTNRLAARKADTVAVTFPSSVGRFRRPERCVVTGNPVRPNLLELDRDRARQRAARERFGLAPDIPTVLVFGGSQGSRSINDAIVQAHGIWGDTNVQILHAAGKVGYNRAAAAWEGVRAQTSGPRGVLIDFIENMDEAYAASDVVVCRAGATSIAELTVLGIPAVLVPYPHATADHQTGNAQALARTGGAVMIEDGQLDALRLVDAVRPLFADADQYANMSRAARAFGRRDAAANVARLVLGHIDGEGTP